jgi:uncharacterized protein YndB with AHSA1/START domain
MAARPSAAAAKSAKRELVITRIFDAPPRLVFKAWTEPERLVRWWGPQGFTTPSCKLDVRPGGAWRICMRAPDGTDLWLQGAYREVVEPERLVYSWAWEDAEGDPGHETLVTVTFAKHGEKTKLTVHQAVFESVKARDMHQGGWTVALNHLAEYLARA